ncbi:hypothetical protein [Bradyrhizobium sp. th.b2]|uniref:hypothetical protein n=1 Tax=Bradyrhizobium sp. th-b2 TaxID=172088 RepID=UPI00041C2C33|nr:hypothetical protein [Bradyrhizobium sp. th.b2]
MADETPAGPQPDPAKRYRVKLARAIEVAPGIYGRPFDHEVIIEGSAIAGFGDAIIGFEEV